MSCSVMNIDEGESIMLLDNPRVKKGESVVL